MAAPPAAGPAQERLQEGGQLVGLDGIPQERGQVPSHPPVGMQIPTVMDPSLAPEGFHVATTYGFFFPCDAPREQMADRILDRLSEWLPDLRDCIVERAVFSSDHFAAMQGARKGDFTHGLIHPEQMLGGRLWCRGRPTPHRSGISISAGRPAIPVRASRSCPATALPGRWRRTWREGADERESCGRRFTRPGWGSRRDS